MPARNDFSAWSCDDPAGPGTGCTSWRVHELTARGPVDGGRAVASATTGRRGVTVAKHLLERDVELAHIQTLIESALAGEGRYLLIEGPAGIGKTRLIEAARGRARDAGMTVLAARGGELESEFPYGLVRQLFKPALAAATPVTRERLLSGAARAAGVLFAPENSYRADAPEAGHKLAALHALYWLTANLAAQ